MTRRPPHRSRRAVLPHRAPQGDARPHSRSPGEGDTPQGGGLVHSGPAGPAQVSCEDGVPRSPLPPVDGSPVLRVRRGEPTLPGPSAALGVLGSAALWPGSHGASQVLRAALAACPALRTPTDPLASGPAEACAWAAPACKRSPAAFGPSRGWPRRPGVRSSVRPPAFPGDASPGVFGAVAPPRQGPHAGRGVGST